MTADTWVMSPEQQRQSNQARRRKHRQAILHEVASHSSLIFFSIIFLFPLYLVFVISVMNFDQISDRSLWPSPFMFDRYTTIFQTVPFLKWTLNTFIVAFAGMVGTVVSSVPPAYVLAHLQWKGRQTTFVIILATMMLPSQVTFIPVYVTFHNMGWIPSFLPMIVPAFFSSAFSIFLLRQFFVSIPEELTDAARIDGCSELQLMLRIMIPLAKPAIAAVGLFAFLGSWNDFFGPLLYLVENPDLWTLGLGLNQFKGEHRVDQGMMMTASFLFMLPMIVVFLMSQKVFVEGVTLTGVKG